MKRTGGFIVAASMLIAACGGAGTGVAGPEGSGSPGYASASPAPSATAVATSTPEAVATPVPSATAVATATPEALATPVPSASPAPSANPTASASLLDYKIDTMVAGWWHLESLKCGGPTGQWDIHVSGVRDLGGGVNLVLTGEGAVTLSKGPTGYSGPWGAQFGIDLVGVPQSIGGQDGTILGNGELVGDTLALLAASAKGSFFSQTPALALGGASGNPAKHLLLPVKSGHFC